MCPYGHPFVKEIPPSRASHFIAEIFSEGDRAHRTVVDAGSGEGQNTLFLLGEGFRVTALDVSQRNLDIVSRKVAGAQIPSSMFDYHVSDLTEEIPIESATIDVVLDVWVLGSVILQHDGREGAGRYLAEAHRILKGDGLFVTQFETLKKRRSPDELRKYLGNLMKGNFSIATSEAVEADYGSYLEIPKQAKLHPALFAVARKL
jgi:SAM-dependent methyltransferase